MVLFTIGEGFVSHAGRPANIPRAYFEAATADGATPAGVLAHHLSAYLAGLLLFSFRGLIISMQNTFTLLCHDLWWPYYATTYVPLLIGTNWPSISLTLAWRRRRSSSYLLLLMLIAGVLNIVRGWLDA